MKLWEKMVLWAATFGRLPSRTRPPRCPCCEGRQFTGSAFQVECTCGCGKKGFFPAGTACRACGGTGVVPASILPKSPSQPTEADCRRLAEYGGGFTRN